MGFRTVAAKDQSSLDERLKEYLVKRAQLDALEAELDEMKRGLKAEYKDQLKDGSFEVFTSDGSGKAQFEPTETTRFASAKFKVDHPTLFETYSSTSKGSKLTIRAVAPKPTE